uniref:Endonuclease/exonuclease/phosphatase family protein n=1 Tax=Ascaris lumbricoides TaxID=6252 RepID=A0A0M3HIF4_ASCLU
LFKSRSRSKSDFVKFERPIVGSLNFNRLITDHIEII